MRCESHFKSSFGNEKESNLKKIKIVAEPVAAMAEGPAQAALRLGCDGRQIPQAESLAELIWFVSKL